MGRKKISMNFIEDDRKRASTFEKRRIGLFKKASELNRLCGVHISVIIVNKDSVYKFSDPPDSFIKNFLNHKHEKIEEDFNNDSLLDFINKKAQKNPYGNDNNSNEHQSLEEEPNDTLTDDELGPKFLDVLDKHHLLDAYNNLDTDISPTKECVNILQTTDQKNLDQVNSSGLMYDFSSNNQINSHIKSNMSIPSINQFHRSFPSKLNEESIVSNKIESVYSDLVPMSTDPSYLFDNSAGYSISSQNWQAYKLHNYSNSHLNFNSNANYQNSDSYLETPTFEICSNGTMSHLSNILPTNLNEDDNSPKLKKFKYFNDSTDPSYFQQSSN